VAHVYTALLGFVAPRGLGTLRFAPLRLRLWEGKFREPDVLLLLAEHDDMRREQYWEGADLVVEVVSTDDRRRVLVTKRREYARAGIPEYWIVDPGEERVVVLRLDGERYSVHGEFGRGARATSVLLEGFELDVDVALDAR
jgi:Uma2 family endonuclease